MPIERVSREQFKTILGNVTAAVAREKEHLSQLDSHIGDGDHGFGMANGFRLGFEHVSQTAEGSIEDYLQTMGFSLLKEVGGASGTIFGSLFLGMAKGAKGHEEIALADFCAMLVEGLTLVQQRGKAQKQLLMRPVPILCRYLIKVLLGRAASVKDEHVCGRMVPYKGSHRLRLGRINLFA